MSLIWDNPYGVRNAECGVRSAECGTTSLRVATFTRINFSFFLTFTSVRPLIDFDFWMKCEVKGNYSRGVY